MPTNDVEIVGGTTRVFGKCINCDADWEVFCPTTGYLLWRDGELIQDALPALTPEKRELLISSCCNNCFEKMFCPW